MITVTISPKFDSKLIYGELVEKNWIEFQDKAFSLGEEMLSYMHQIIANKTKGESSGNLIRSIKFYPGRTAPAMVEWGIGLKSELDTLAPYWHLLDVGGASFKGDYHFTPGFFSGGKFTYNPMIAEGAMLPSGTKGIHNPMHYIDETRLQLDRELQMLIQSLKKSTSSGSRHGWGRGAGGAK